MEGETAMLMTFKKILCPTDFSDASRLAIDLAADLAARDKGELWLVHVIDAAPTDMMDPNFAMKVPEYERMRHAEAQRQLDALAACCKQVNVRTMVGHGDPGSEIVRIAQEEAVDMIVMPTHGRTGLQHVVFGSVAEKVVRLARRPVLTLPGPPTH
jgi:nucleotide-binding universal stress UspA family protein